MITLKAIIINAPAALRQALDRIIGKMALIRHLAAVRPGPILSATASAKAALRALARRWLTLDAEIRTHDANLETLTVSKDTECAIRVASQPLRNTPGFNAGAGAV
jgi:transposase